MQSANYMWCALFVCIVLMSGSSHGLLTTGEKDALAELLSIFPNLGYIGTSQVGHDQNIDYGRAWTNNFDSLCLSDGYDYYGLYCSGGHISGLVFTQAWEPAVLQNFSAINGLSFLKNVTVTTTPLVAPMEAMVLTLAGTFPLERMSCENSPIFLNGSFGYPSSLVALRAHLSEDFDLTPFESLQSLETSIGFAFPPTRLVNGIWPTSLESLKILSIVAMNDILELAGNLTNLKYLDVASYADTNESSEGILVSDSIDNLQFRMLSGPARYALTLNSTSLKIASLDTEYGPLVLNTPNVQKLAINQYNGLPSGFTELYHLEDLGLTNVNVSRPEIGNLGFAVNLTSLSFEYWVIEPSDLSSVLCNVATNNPKWASLKLHQITATNVGVIYELPTCIRDAAQLKSLDVAGFSSSPLHAASITTSLPPLIEELRLSPGLDNATNIYNFTQFGQLKVLHLLDQGFVGEMKDDFFSFFPNLEELAIFSNFVNGTIPSVGWANMRVISLSAKFNQWTGLDSAPFLHDVYIVSDALETIPNDAYLVNLRELENFRVEPSRSASIPTPSFWTKLPKLSYFVITYANFSGPITSSIAAPRLRTVSLDRSICGPLPEFDIPTVLDQLLFPDNRFSGTIPQSWATNLAFRTGISLAGNKLSGTIPPGFLKNRIGLYALANLQGNYFTGPVWDLSQTYPSFGVALSYNNFNVCDSLSLPSDMVMGTCRFLNVSVCPEAASECLAAWTRSCVTFQCTTQSEARVPPIEECIAPVNPAMIGQCPPPGPPGFQCNVGQWIAYGSVSIASVSLPPDAGVMVVNGDLTVNGSLTFDGIGTSIVVEGCVENVPTEIVIVLKGDEKLKTITILSQQGRNCSTDLASIPVTLVQRKDNCRQVKSSTEDSTRSSLVVAFDLDSRRCNLKWIILGSVLGGIIVLGTLGIAVMYRLSRRFRAFVRSCKPTKLLV